MTTGGLKWGSQLDRSCGIAGNRYSNSIRDVVCNLFVLFRRCQPSDRLPDSLTLRSPESKNGDEDGENDAVMVHALSVHHHDNNSRYHHHYDITRTSYCSLEVATSHFTGSSTEFQRCQYRASIHRFALAIPKRTFCECRERGGKYDSSSQGLGSSATDSNGMAMLFETNHQYNWMKYERTLARRCLSFKPVDQTQGWWLVKWPKHDEYICMEYQFSEDCWIRVRE